MKIKLLFLAILLLSANISHAQDSLQKNKNDNSVFIDISAGISKQSTPSLSIKGIYSHKYNEQFLIGVGTGIYYNSYMERNTHTYSIDLPIFINIRGDINLINVKKSGNITPYYSFSIGYFFNIMSAINEYTIISQSNDFYGANNSYQIRYINYYEGLYFAPEIGININDIYIGAEFLYGSSKNEIHKNYLYPYLTYDKDSSSYNTTISYIISLKFVQKL